MPAERLPESVHTLYAELLDQAVEADAEAAARELPPAGTFVSKQVKGHTYWYLQRSVAGRREQRYLGADSPPLRRWMERVEAARSEREPDARRRAELVDMLLAGGATREPPAQGRVLEALAEAGVFRLGGVLVGTHAFAAYGNMLGVRFAGRHLRTQDVDVASDPRIALALGGPPANADVPSALVDADGRFVPVPGLDPRHPSTSFKVRGRDLRVDFLVPRQRYDAEDPVPLPRFGVAAQPLRFLGYLLEDTEPAVLLYRSGVLVTVPTPARFAFHKLWLAGERRAGEQARSRKDRAQAAAVLEVLARDRPGDLQRAWGAVGGKRKRELRQRLDRLEEPVREAVLEIVR